jgi:hypothetical protein
MHISLLLKFSTYILFVEFFSSPAEQQHFPHIIDQVSFKLQMQLFRFIELSHKQIHYKISLDQQPTACFTVLGL